MGLLLANVVPSASGFSYDAVTFDGTNDYLAIGGAMVGATDGPEGSISFFIKMGALSDGESCNIFKLDPNGIQVLKYSADAIDIAITNSGSGKVLEFHSSSGSISEASGWCSVLISWKTDLGAGAKLSNIYINDSSDNTVFSDSSTSFSADYTNTEVNVGADSGGFFKLIGSLAEFWFAPTYIDFSNVTERRKFVDASNKPVDLGADGSTPLGTAPLIYLHVDAGETPNNFAFNVGTGGGMTVTGALALAASKP